MQPQVASLQHIRTELGGYNNKLLSRLPLRHARLSKELNLGMSRVTNNGSLVFIGKEEARPSARATINIVSVRRSEAGQLSSLITTARSDHHDDSLEHPKTVLFRHLGAEGVDNRVARPRIGVILALERQAVLRRSLGSDDTIAQVGRTTRGRLVARRERVPIITGAASKLPLLRLDWRAIVVLGNEEMVIGSVDAAMLYIGDDAYIREGRIILAFTGGLQGELAREGRRAGWRSLTTDRSGRADGCEGGDNESGLEKDHGAV